MTYLPSVKLSQPAAAAAIQAQAVAGGATLSLAFGAGVRETTYVVTLTQNCAITITGGVAATDQVMTVDLVQGGSGGFVPSFTNVSWAGGIAPGFNAAAGKRDMVQMRAVGADVMGWPVSMGRLPLVAALPTAPAGVTVVAAANQITISAGGVSAYPAVTGYNLYAGVSAGGESAVPIASNVSLPYVDAGLAAGVTRFYRVAAVNSVGISTLSTEVSATPGIGAAANPTHYVSFAAVDNVIYASPNAAFNPGANPFDMQVHVRMANWATSGYAGTGETCLWGCWDVNVANRLWRLGLTATGAVRASWAVGASTDLTAVSSAVIPAAGGTDLWIRAVVTPTTGAVAFYTSSDAVTWAALGVAQTAAGTGAVYTPGTLPYLVIGANASGGSTGNAAEQFAGRFYEARLYVNGALVTDPVAGASAVTDSKGVSYSISGVSIV